jgi:hypothetical protein
MRKFLRSLVFWFRFKKRQINSKRRMDPSFFIVGAQKAGTTSLYKYLVQHPLIVPSLTKEIHYFDLNYHKPLSWYKAFFPLTRNNTQFITGEATPYYMFHPYAIKRIAKIYPNSKIIILLRDPVSRAISHYYHEVRKGREVLDIKMAFREEQARLLNDMNKFSESSIFDCFNHQVYSYRERGVYINQIREIKKHFNDKNITIIESNEFFNNTEEVVKGVLDFLNVDSDFKIKTDKIFNVGVHKKDPNENAIRLELIEYYKRYNAELYRLIGREFKWK